MKEVDLTDCQNTVVCEPRKKPLGDQDFSLWKPNPAEFRDQLDSFDLTSDEERELLEALARIAQHFIERCDLSK